MWLVFSVAYSNSTNEDVFMFPENFQEPVKNGFFNGYFFISSNKTSDS